MKEEYVFRLSRVGRDIPAGKVNDHICAFYDLMPTFCEVIGIKDYEKKYRNKEKRSRLFRWDFFCSHTAG